MISFADNPLYKQVFSNSAITLYCPSETHSYHISRHIAAHAQNIYSGAGITKDLLGKYIDEILQRCNLQSKFEQRITDIGVLCNNLKYRMKYPVDDECAIRMGAIYTFMQGENPDTVINSFTDAKIAAAREHPDLYDFFLTEGKRLTPSWKAYEQDLNDTEYSTRRELQLKTLLPV